MLIKWFDATEAKLFGEEIADTYIARVKKDQDKKNEKFIERRQKELLMQITQKIKTFKMQHELNTYKKAQLGNAVKWKLLDAGFDKEYADDLTGWIVRQI